VNLAVESSTLALQDPDLAIEPPTADLARHEERCERRDADDSHEAEPHGNRPTKRTQPCHQVTIIGSMKPGCR
jgi:hypothetical protein